MSIGKINVLAGGVAILLSALGGFALGFTRDPLYEDGFYKVSYGRGLIKAGHTHGMPFALYNLIIGVMIDRLPLTDNLNIWLSRLAIGAFIMPIGLILRGLQNGAMTFAPVGMIGSVCFLALVVLMINGTLTSN